MADPITNAQFALGIFQPAAESIGRINAQRLALAEHQAEQRRQDSLMHWKRQQQLADNMQEMGFREKITDKQIAAQLQGQREQMDRLIKEAEFREKRATAAAVNQLYGEYAELTRDGAKPLVTFGKTEQEQLESLSREVGKLRQTVLLGEGVGKLFTEYGMLGGTGKVTDFGSTPSEQIQGLSKEIGTLRSKKAKNAYLNLGTEVSKVSEEIRGAEKLSDEEMQQASNAGLMAMTEKARAAYARYRSVLGEQGAMTKLAKEFPAEADAYRSAINQTVVALRMNKRDNDKLLRELYDRQTGLQQMRARAAMNLMDVDPEAILSVQPATPAAPALGRVTESDVRKTTLNNVVPMGRPEDSPMTPAPTRAPAPFIPKSNPRMIFSPDNDNPMTAAPQLMQPATNIIAPQAGFFQRESDAIKALAERNALEQEQKRQQLRQMEQAWLQQQLVSRQRMLRGSQ